MRDDAPIRLQIGGVEVPLNEQNVVGGWPIS